MKKSASFQILLVVFLLCLATPLSAVFAAAAQDPVATVVAVRGTVVAQGKSGPSRTLSLKSQIFQEDVLKTDKTGQLQIMFTDNSIISLGRDSEMKIAEYRWQPEQKDGALKTQVKEGTFRVMGGALAKDAPQNFKTETPTATIGIRGSMYTFRATQDSLSILFQGGKGIDIFNDLGRVSITVPGFGTHVLLNAPPARPTKFTEQEINNLNRGLNGNGGADNGGPPLAGSGLAPKPSERPVLPPVNEYPTAPDFTLPPPPPTDGIFAFNGALGGVYSRTDGSTETFINGLSMGVNWYNHRLFGIAYDNNQGDKPVFFFGSVNGSTVSDLNIFGIDDGYQNNDIAFINGSGVGVFAGAAYDFFGFAATGNTTLIKNPQASLGSWIVAGGGQQMSGAMTPVAPKGTDTWQGFATGLSVDLQYRTFLDLFQSSSPNDFTMTVNKNVGTINGTMSLGWGINFGDSYSEVSGLQIGGDTTNSVYLRDDLMAALIPNADTIALKPHGNFMVVADPSEQFSSYVTWGYWQIAYDESSTESGQALMAGSHSLWIAGVPTDIHPGNFIGEYNGGARGTRIDGTGATQLSGSLYLKANFTNSSIDAGSITFPNVVTLAITPTSPGAISFSNVTGGGNSFSASISGGTTSGTIKGAFFGPAANAVGGNFSSSGETVQYIGIFGGNRGALTPYNP